MSYPHHFQHPPPRCCRYVINVRQIAKFVVGLGQKVSPTDIEEGMRVGVDRTKYFIQVPVLAVCGILFGVKLGFQAPHVPCIVHEKINYIFAFW